MVALTVICGMSFGAVGPLTCYYTMLTATNRTFKARELGEEERRSYASCVACPLCVGRGGPARQRAVPPPTRA